MTLPFVTDSRRLTGASLVLPVPGAILEVTAPVELKTKLRVYWRHLVKKLLLRVGWSDALVITRDQGPSQILAISAPIDGLLTATHITEWAWEAALTRCKLAEAISLSEATDSMLGRIAREAKPGLAALYRAAVLRRVPVLLSENELSLGEGCNARIFPFDDLPEPSEIAWRPKRRQLPTVLVTGTNGKTTTVRLLARMLATAGQVVGFCSTDFVQVGEEILVRDDYSGPTGARLVLRNPNTETAVLEVARGGMLRRGLQVTDADVGVVTNVADDHLGENGIHTLMQLAEAKFTIQRGLRRDAPMVVNADDEHCRTYARKLTHPICWFGFQRPSASITKGLAPRAGLVYLDAGNLCVELMNGQSKQFDDESRISLVKVEECPLSLRGGARYNIANMLAATAAAVMMDCPIAAIQATLLSFGRHPSDNPGRANVYEIAGAQVLVDYGHNPDGVSAILDAAAVLPHKRLLIGVGLPGDRSDEAAVAVGARVAKAKATQVIVKEMAMYLRGRPEGQLSGILRASLKKNGYSERKTSHVRSDAELLDRTLAWLKPGDLAVLFLHESVGELSAKLLALTE
jgi:cyanophycin synthetase